MISFNELKTKIDKYGYYATDELLYDTYNSLLLFESDKINPGQDIFAVCLEGPPGAGKTEYAKVYTKVSNEIFNNVEIVDYQCDATTGKTELFEDINISAAIRGDADNVNIPGKLVEAIKKVNEGKRVVLFIDEYDKAREETDAFLLQFLQSGKINSTQHGDLEVLDQYKTNLQVILCKNDMREELSGPLSRRIRIIRLDYMEPSTFYKIANRVLVVEKEQPVDDGILNLVTLMYEAIYSEKEMFNRLPSCSEMLIAINDADRILKNANAPESIIYNMIIRNLLKSEDDIKAFETILDNNNNDNFENLNSLIEDMKSSTLENEDKININSMIAEKVFKEENEELIEKTKEMRELIQNYKDRYENLKDEKKSNDILKIDIDGEELIGHQELPEVMPSFYDESKNIKRGKSIFDLSNENWTEIASVSVPNLVHEYFIDTIIENASKLDVSVYENGILLNSKDGVNLIAVSECSEDNIPSYKILCSTVIMPSEYLIDIKNFTEYLYNFYKNEHKVVAYEDNCNYEIDALIYSDINISETVFELSKKAFVSIRELDINNVTHFIARESGISFDSLAGLEDYLKSSDYNKIITSSNEIINGYSRVKK